MGWWSRISDSNHWKNGGADTDILARLKAQFPRNQLNICGTLLLFIFLACLKLVILSFVVVTTVEPQVDSIFGTDYRVPHLNFFRLLLDYVLPHWKKIC